MTPRESFVDEMVSTTESAIRAELSLFGFEPSEMISKTILINILCAVYFEG